MLLLECLGETSNIENHVAGRDHEKEPAKAIQSLYQ